MSAVVSKFLQQTDRHLQPHRRTLSGLVIATALATYGYKILYPAIEKHLVQRAENRENLINNNEQVPSPTPPPPQVAGLKKHIPNLNLRFILQFIRLMRIMIPHPFSHETGLLVSHTLFLFARTFLSIYVANLEGAIVKYIVKKDPGQFSRQLVKWFLVAVPATFINSTIKYLEAKIALRFRTRLVHHSYQLYFTNQAYYRVTVLDGRLDNCAQRLTDDIETVANTVSHLWGQVTKPCFDILLMALALGQLIRSRHSSNLLLGPAVISGVVVVSGLLLRVVSPRFGQLVAQEAEKKGYLRLVHGRIVANAEEIAFYGGHRVEASHLKQAYQLLTHHLEHIFAVKLWFVMLEQFLMKYLWSGTGMVVVALPILMAAREPSRSPSDSVSDRTQYFTTAKNLLITGSNAVERLMSSYKDVVELAGHTQRVANMFQVLDQASRGVYHKTVIERKSDAKSEGFRVEFRGNQPIANGLFVHSANGNIELRNVPIVTPNCDVVCPSLSLVLQPGQHLLITGPNGCGKSSLFRILSGLWPVYGGELHSPKNSMFYIPQRPYMVIGNLRDQVIYPDTYADMINKQVREDDLRRIMQLVHLEHIVERDTFHQVKDWTDILSGGEKQRMAMARLFYHRPKYALLDECTSAVSIDVESHMYQAAIDMGITLLTITHRPTLWKFHTHILQFDGTGNWDFSRLNCTDRLDLKKEKEALLRNADSEEKARRLQELNKLLGEEDDHP